MAMRVRWGAWGAWNPRGRMALGYGPPEAADHATQPSLDTRGARAKCHAPVRPGCGPGGVARCHRVG